MGRGQAKMGASSSQFRGLIDVLTLGSTRKIRQTRQDIARLEEATAKSKANTIKIKEETKDAKARTQEWTA